MVTVGMRKDDAREFVRPTVERQIPGQGQLIFIVASLGGAAVDGIDVSTLLHLEEVTGAGDGLQGSMEFKEEGHGVGDAVFQRRLPAQAGLLLRPQSIVARIVQALHKVHIFNGLAKCIILLPNHWARILTVAMTPVRTSFSSWRNTED